MKVIIHKYDKELPIEIIGRIVELDENNETIVNVKGPNGGVDFRVQLKEGQYRKIYISEDDEIIVKLLKGEKLSEDELQELFFEFDDLVLERGSDVPRRWSQIKWNKINAFGRFFMITGDIGLTENQEHSFYTQPEELSFNPGVRTIQVFNFNLGRLVK